MPIDWDFAIEVGGIGFGIVFGVLILLAILTKLLGVVVGRIEAGRQETDDNQKGA
jgi:Na+-transporting methylmalonyl-CoA/oxaloacetate decarboxylase gamma subunit